MKHPRNLIYKATLMHCRLKPNIHKFIYNIFYFFINIDDLNGLNKKYIFFSYNKFNIFSINDKDHGFRNKTKIKSWLKEILKNIKINIFDTKIFIFTIPRILGYSFNPLTIFFCYDKKNNLKALIYEVKNTFNEQHSYIFKINKKLLKKKYLKHSSKKNFHVSPFWPMHINYNFIITEPKKNFFSKIKMIKENDEIFHASLKCKSNEINFKNLLYLMIQYPFTAIKVVLAIYYEAFKIFFFKKAKYYKKPKLKKNLTIIK